MTISLYPGDRIRYLDEPATFGTLMSEPYDNKASLRLDDGRAVRVHVSKISRITLGNSSSTDQ